MISDILLSPVLDVVEILSPVAYSPDGKCIAAVLIPFDIGILASRMRASQFYTQIRPAKTTLTVALPIAGFGTLCTNVGDSPEPTEIAGAAIPLLYGLLLLILALYKTIEFWKKSSGLKDFLLVRVLVRDQFIYYASIGATCICKIVEVPVFNASPFIADVLDLANTNILLCVFGGQLLINLKDVAEKGGDGGTGRTLGEIEFQDRQVHSNSQLSGADLPRTS